MTISFDGQRAYDHVEHLSVEIGPRVIGTEGDKQAADYIRSHFESLGLEVREQPFEVQTGSLLAHKLEILEPALGEIPSRPVLLSPDTPEEGLTGELVFAEGSSEPQLGPHLAGKIVLWSNRGRSHSEQVKLLKYGPLAIVGISPTIGVKPKHYMMNRDIRPYEPVTAFQVTYEDGLRLIRSGARKTRLYLRSERFKGTTRNVIAELKGSHHPEEIIVIGGHYDTVPDLPGAIDDAAGTAIVMELARLYAERGSKRTLRFVAWTGEEGGLLGSRHYVRELKKRDEEERAAEGFDERRDKTELERHLFCLNFDVHGMILGHNHFRVAAPPEVLATLKVLSKELGIPTEVSDQAIGNDHIPLACAGVPSITFNRDGGSVAYIHTPEDAMAQIDGGHLEEVGRFVDIFLWRTMAGAQVWPFERQVPEKSKKELEKILKGLLPHAEENGTWGGK